MHSSCFVSVTFGIAGAILIESGLSFLGLGVQPPSASWEIFYMQESYIETAWCLQHFQALQYLLQFFLITCLVMVYVMPLTHV